MFNETVALKHDVNQQTPKIKKLPFTVGHNNLTEVCRVSFCLLDGCILGISNAPYKYHYGNKPLLCLWAKNCVNAPQISPASASWWAISKSV